MPRYSSQQVGTGKDTYCLLNNLSVYGFGWFSESHLYKMIQTCLYTVYCSFGQDAAQVGGNGWWGDLRLLVRCIKGVRSMTPTDRHGGLSLRMVGTSTDGSPVPLLD